MTSTTVPKAYGHSVEASAVKAAFHNSKVFGAVVIVNALLQALILIPAPMYGYQTALFFTLGILSGIVLLAALAIILSAALNSGVDNSFRGAFARIRPNLGRFVLWSVLWMIVILIGLLLDVVPGFIIMAATPYVLFAALEGKSNPLMSNFRAIKARPGRYIAVLIATFFILWVLLIVSGLISFTVYLPLSGLLQWLYTGFFGCWLISGWALLWRSTPEGARTAKSTESDQSTESALPKEPAQSTESA